MAANKPNLNKLQKQIESAFKKLHENGGYDPKDILEYNNLIDAYAQYFNNAIDTGIKDNEVPQSMLTKLQENVFHFSGLKTHAQLLEASKMLVDENGKIKSFSKFSQDVAKIKENYNQNYLEAEYEFAVGSAQAASNWNNLTDTDRYNLQYRTAQDDKVRDSHQALANITLPASDEFWNNYYPPNGWRCRCVAVEVRKEKYETTDSKKAIEAGEKATTLIGSNDKNKLEMFRFNPGKQQRIFPLGHPYFKVKDAGKIEQLILPKIEVLEGVNKKASDYKDVYDSAKHFSNLGKKVEVLPNFNGGAKTKEYKSVFSDLIGTKFEGKCPDLKIDGIYYEHEGFITKNAKNAFKNMVNGGQKQATRLILEDCGLEDSYMIRNIKNRIFINKQSIDEVWIKSGKKLRLIYKNAKTP